ncbi:DUF4198 domain-containing protein [Paraburkholderia sp. J67]|uniref:DUF4198 domain-containing protein n=1 Tax=Paraburkholderia sp. J67 TaxID=2805435 RepID=UPI002ABD6990|nr:DUF4198 domain-containing protein [Paraburkholderia sp. J67]
MKLSSARFSAKASALAFAALMPLAAHADRLWLLPSATVLSGNDTWVSVDAAVSDDLFIAGHAPLRLDGLVITAPDGSTGKAENAVTGRFRSVFDLQLTQDGTWRITVDNQMIGAQYKLDGEKKRWRGSVEAFAKEVPANAQDLEVMENDMRVETFVAHGKPSTTALKPTGHGLELVPISSPVDLVSGSTGNFQLMLDGKPAANVKVAVVPGGTRYRDDIKETTLTTDQDGKFNVKFADAGMYWLGAQVRDNHTQLKQAKMRRAAYAATLEVLPQ